MSQQAQPDLEQRIEALANEWYNEEIKTNAAQAKRHGWDEPLAPSWTIEQQRTRARNTLTPSERMKAETVRQERYKSIWGHYPKQSIIGQGR